MQCSLCHLQVLQYMTVFLCILQAQVKAEKEHEGAVHLLEVSGHGGPVANVRMASVAVFKMFVYARHIDA